MVEAEEVVGPHTPCSENGDLLWSKGADGSDHFSMCYAPSLFGGGLGPTGGHQQCDAGSYFFTESPKFCCKNPRLDIGGTTVLGKKDTLCGDVWADFDEDTQMIKFIAGPRSTAKKEQLQELWGAGLGDMVPSPVGFKAVKEGEEAQPVIQAVCRGDRATLVVWKRPPGSDKGSKAELCPTGTPPVQGQSYMSFSCDGYVTQERRYHCCKVNGRLKCSARLVDTTSMEPPCNCKQNELGQPKAEAKASGADAVEESSCAPLLLSFLAAGPASVRRRRTAASFL
eukprot:TRINITY_DN77985_c0_g1_i1.p1 TRINITY_DN77985_c0_g1~~TRINITY_DN77985_c0_g1_i1.p1  ORF type:complete len:283 (+),score=68.98 TRINITY_DN77985_c0_g1_i1:117-965(+)